MKKKYLFTAHNRQWDVLVRKFINLYQRVRTGVHSKANLFRMLKKMQNIYERLHKMQYSVGVKLAGTTLAFMLTSAICYSQTYNYTFIDNLKGYPADIGIAKSGPEFIDIDGDGDLDMYVEEMYGNTILAFVNDGEGNFTEAESLKVDGTDFSTQGVSTFVFADIDRDGDLDMYIGYRGEDNINAGKIKTYINDGSGNFTSGGMLRSGGAVIDVGEFSSPEFGDVDDDGDLDLYVGNYNGTINIFTNTGDGSFTAAGYLKADGSIIDVGEESVCTIANVDGDDDLDIYVGNNDGYFSVFTNNGSGVFSAKGFLMVDGVKLDGGYHSEISFADIDNDSDLDIYLRYHTNNIFVCNNDGNATFTNAGKMQANGAGLNVDYFSKPEIADLDGDGDLDLLSGDYGGYISAFINEGSGKLSTIGYIQADGEDIRVEFGSAPALADIDGDSDIDLFVGDKYGNLKVYINNGSNNFSAAGDFNADGIIVDFNEYVNLAFADLDNDNDQDLYVGNSGYVKTYLNDGSGNFLSAGNLQADGRDISFGNDYLIAPAFADVDKDGDLDLFLSSCDGIYVYVNYGSGIFSENGKVYVDNLDILYYNCPISRLADLDNDGDLELYTSTLYGFINKFEFLGTSGTESLKKESDISVYPNPSNGIFTVKTNSYYSISVYDVSGKNIIVNSGANLNEPMTKTLDLSKSKSGVYFAKFQNNQKVQIKKIVVK